MVMVLISVNSFSIYAGISIKVKQAMLMTFYTIFSSCPPGNGPQDGLPSTKCGT